MIFFMLTVIILFEINNTQVIGFSASNKKKITFSQFLNTTKKVCIYTTQVFEKIYILNFISISTGMKENNNYCSFVNDFYF